MMSFETKIAWAIARIANCLSAMLNLRTSPPNLKKLYKEEMDEVAEQMSEIIEVDNIEEEMKNGNTRLY